MVAGTGAEMTGTEMTGVGTGTEKTGAGVGTGLETGVYRFISLDVSYMLYCVIIGLGQGQGDAGGHQATGQHQGRGRREGTGGGEKEAREDENKIALYLMFFLK